MRYYHNKVLVPSKVNSYIWIAFFFMVDIDAGIDQKAMSVTDYCW